jgi:hypothetical protein
MVAAQVAIAVAVVFGAAIAGRTFVTVLRTPLGFSADRVVEIAVSPAAGVTGGREFYQQVVQALARRPDVLAAGATGSQPFSRSAANEGARVRIDDVRRRHRVYVARLLRRHEHTASAAARSPGTTSAGIRMQP